MRIGYFTNSFHAVNWGGQATSHGILRAITRDYPDADFIPLDFNSLPYRHVAFLRSALARTMGASIVRQQHDRVVHLLHRYNVDTQSLPELDAICFNGEGAIHSKSGHLFRFLGLLSFFKATGCYVAACNQTVDLAPEDRNGRSALASLYSRLDYVSAREPVSCDLLRDLGVGCVLMPDAAYALPPASVQERARARQSFGLSEHGFVAVTGSSALRRNWVSVRRVERLVHAIENATEKPIVFLANTKTDLCLATKLAVRSGLRVISFRDADYTAAKAVLANASLVVGGRQHPSIFASQCGIPFIPFPGNTHKMEGLVRLLDNPVGVQSWEEDPSELAALAAAVLEAPAEHRARRVPMPEHIRIPMVAKDILKVGNLFSRSFGVQTLEPDNR